MKLIEVYTDGACSQGMPFTNWPGGYAALLLINGEIISSFQKGVLHTTNNEMELNGFLVGLEMAESSIEKDSDLIIYTDSAYIHNCLNQKWYEKWIINGWKTAMKQPVKNKELWIKILNLVNKLNPKILKVKAHTNNKYNNYVDILAVEAKEKGGEKL